MITDRLIPIFERLRHVAHDASSRFFALSHSLKIVLITGTSSCLLALLTIISLHAPPAQLAPGAQDLHQPQFVDRNGEALNITFDNPFNLHDYMPLHEIPLFVQQAFILAEDQRFYAHSGVDWRARLNALWQNVRAGRTVRGASTITEQVVRILHPRPRTVWSRWVEGLEATWFETRFSKAEILEFYLNEVPYARRRRGVRQAALLYFDREPDTLNVREMLALAVLVRAPGRLDLLRHDRDTQRLDRAIDRLAVRLQSAGVLDSTASERLEHAPLALRQGAHTINAAHFVQHLKTHFNLVPGPRGRITTTLDAELQQATQAILDARIRMLGKLNAGDGAVLVIDHQNNEVLAWVNGGDYDTDTPGAQIDAITSARQPGSTLKPFLYALALERGWTAATLIDDSPLSQAVGAGQHHFDNYSRRYHGPVRLRDALANSLNIPAIHTVAFVGRARLLERLQALGLKSLALHPDHYGDGLALGNGEVTLQELTLAYAALARGGHHMAVRLYRDAPTDMMSTQIFTPEISSLIAHILSDPDARRLEFGTGALLNFPVETAVKTGTSTAYRDAWAMGFNHRYTVGVWMGNLDRTPMARVNGSTGPALVLRAVFAELNRRTRSRPLYLSPRLLSVHICRATGELAIDGAPSLREWFRSEHVPKTRCRIEKRTQLAHARRATQKPRLIQPTPGLYMAMDPRIPDHLERFAMRLNQPAPGGHIEWFIDGKRLATTGGDHPEYLWPLARGSHRVHARIWTRGTKQPAITQTVNFYVK